MDLHTSIIIIIRLSPPCIFLANVRILELKFGTLEGFLVDLAESLCTLPREVHTFGKDR